MAVKYPLHPHMLLHSRHGRIHQDQPWNLGRCCHHIPHGAVTCPGVYTEEDDIYALCVVRNHAISYVLELFIYWFRWLLGSEFDAHVVNEWNNASCSFLVILNEMAVREMARHPKVHVYIGLSFT